MRAGLAVVLAAALGFGQTPMVTLSVAEQRSALELAVRLFKARSVYGDQAPALEKRIKEEAAFTRPQPIQAFCSRLQNHLVAVTGDGHHQVQFRREPRPLATLAPPDPSAEAARAAEMRKRLLQQGESDNFGFTRAERLEGNLGYLRMDGSYPGCGPALAGALGFLGRTDALILDLRGNGGGDPEAAMEVLGSLLEGGSREVEVERFADGREVHFHTSHASGATYLHRPVFILVGPRTASAAETLAFALKVSGRAKVVGERTSGSGGTVIGCRIHPNVLMGLSVSRNRSTFDGSTFQAVGITPDLPCAADAALDEARRHALALVALQGATASAREEAKASQEGLAKLQTGR